MALHVYRMNSHKANRSVGPLHRKELGIKTSAELRERNMTFCRVETEESNPGVELAPAWYPGCKEDWQPPCPWHLHLGGFQEVFGFAAFSIF